MSFTRETVDLSGLDDNQIKAKLTELNIPLTPEEGKKIQHEMLGRPPSLTELVLFSIQGSEHCSYKSSRYSDVYGDSPAGRIDTPTPEYGF